MRILLCSLLTVFIPCVLLAEDKPDPNAKLKKAIDNGVEYLRSAHKKDTHWDGFWLKKAAGLEGGETGLACLAMLKCGVKPDDKLVSAALDYLRGLEPKRTYVVSLTIQCMAEAKQVKDAKQIQKLADWLLESARKKDKKIVGWSYPFDKDTSGIADASNTRFAVLGLHAAKHAGAKIEENVWKELLALYLGNGMELPDELTAWSYGMGSKEASYTMTSAALTSIQMALRNLEKHTQQLDEKSGQAKNCGQYVMFNSKGKEVNAVVPLTRGLNWLGKNFALDGVPEQKSTCYFYHCLDNLGEFTGHHFLRSHDWQRELVLELLKTQEQKGFWKEPNKSETLDDSNIIPTSFTLLVLARTRTPVLVTKLAYGEHKLGIGTLQEIGSKDGVVGWNRKLHDAAHITEFASQELFKGQPLAWQIYDQRRWIAKGNLEDALNTEADKLLASPVVYMTGHEAPNLTQKQKDVLKKYIEGGGFILAEACCGSEEFTKGFRELMKNLFPDDKLKLAEEKHSVWTSHFRIEPKEFPKLEVMERSQRTVVVLSPEPLAGFWEERRFMFDSKEKAAASRGEHAFRLSTNVIALATNGEKPKPRVFATK